MRSRPTFVIGAGITPDAECQIERPAGVTAAAALIAHADRAASAVLDSASAYVRLDGTFVGTGAELASGAIASGIWQLADSSYPATQFVGAWTGQTSPGIAGNVASTCDDWTDAALNAVFGNPLTMVRWWNNQSFACSDSTNIASLYCVQTMP